MDPPSYEASCSTGLAHRQSFHTQLSAARTEHIETVILTQILPIIRERACMGLSRTVIAVIPLSNPTTENSYNDSKKHSKSTSRSLQLSPWPRSSSASANPEQPSPSPAHNYDHEHDLNMADSLPRVIDIVSSHDSNDNNDLQHVQLQDPLDSSAFWSQASVLNEFRRLLRKQLDSGTEGIAKGSSSSLPSAVTSERYGDSPDKTSRNSIARRISAMWSSSGKSTEIKGDRNIGTGTDAGGDAIVLVAVEPDEVCLRTVTAFGLYETLTRFAVIVRVALAV